MTDCDRFINKIFFPSKLTKSLQKSFKVHAKSILNLALFAFLFQPLSRQADVHLQYLFSVKWFNNNDIPNLVSACQDKITCTIKNVITPHKIWSNSMYTFQKIWFAITITIYKENKILFIQKLISHVL